MSPQTNSHTSASARAHAHTHTPLIDKTFLPHPLFHTHPTVTCTFGLIFTITYDVTNLEYLLTYMSYLLHSQSIAPHPPSNTHSHPSSHEPFYTCLVIHVSPTHILITHSLAHMNHTKTYNISNNDPAHLFTVHHTHPISLPHNHTYSLIFTHSYTAFLALPSPIQVNSHRHHQSVSTNYTNLPC